MKTIEVWLSITVKVCAVLFCLLSVACAADTGQMPPTETRGASASNPYESTDGGLTLQNFPSAEEIIAGVTKKYRRLSSYRAKGTSSNYTERPGQRIERGEIPLEIEYLGDANSTLRWQHEGIAKTFKIFGKKSWLEEDGKTSSEFSTPTDGLMTIAFAEGGWHIFPISKFLFRRILVNGGQFFAGIENPTIKGSELVDDRLCYILTGSYARVEGSTSFWIDAENSLIRRIEREVIIRQKGNENEITSRTVTTENYRDIEAVP